jgi:hypothetical protein
MTETPAHRRGHGASAGISMFSSTQYAAYLNDASYIDAARGSSSADIVAPVLADYELPRALPRPRATPTAAPPQAPQQVAAQPPPPPPQTQAAPAHIAQQAPPQVHPTPPQAPGSLQPAQPHTPLGRRPRRRPRHETERGTRQADMSLQNLPTRAWSSRSNGVGIVGRLGTALVQWRRKNLEKTNDQLMDLCRCCFHQPKKECVS